MAADAQVVERVIHGAVVTVSADRSVTVTVEGQTFEIEQVQVMAGLASDQDDLPAWVQTALYVQAGLTHAPDLSGEDVLNLARMAWRDRSAMAQSSRFHPMLARDPDSTVRARLASMVAVLAPATDVQVLLAHDPSWEVQMDLAKCAATLCEEASMVLARSTERLIRFTVASKSVNPQVLIVALAALADEPAVLEQICQERIALPEEVRVMLGAHPVPALRIRAALSGLTPTPVLELLTGDTDSQVAAYATETLARVRAGRL